MTLSTLYRSSFFMILLSLATPAAGSFADITHIRSKLTESVSQYFSSSPFLQNTYGTLSNLCQIGTMCGSGLTWLGQTGLAGTNYTTELIKNNPKIAGTIALYTAWYIGQKRWAEDTINKAKEFLHAMMIDPLMSFAKWEQEKYSTITSIMNNKINVAHDLLSDYNSFSSNSFCECLKNRGDQIDQQAKAIKLALEMEYTSAKQILDLFTEGRSIWLTNVPYWIEKWIEDNYSINENIDIFDLYNILATSDLGIKEISTLLDQAIDDLKLTNKRLIEREQQTIIAAKKSIKEISEKQQEEFERTQHSANLMLRNATEKEKSKEKEEEKAESTDITNELEELHRKQTKAKISSYAQVMKSAYENIGRLQRTESEKIAELKKQQAARIYEEDLKELISQKIASTGLPTTRFATEQPRAYWSWIRSAPWSIPSGFIWPYEREASQVYWKLFQYTQRIAALISAISEYMKQNGIQDVGPSYALGQYGQIFNAIKEFLKDSPACDAQYCIKNLKKSQ